MRCKGALSFLAGGLVGFWVHALWGAMQRKRQPKAVYDASAEVAPWDERQDKKRFVPGVDPSDFPAPAGK